MLAKWFSEPHTRQVTTRSSAPSLFLQRSRPLPAPLLSASSTSGEDGYHFSCFGLNALRRDIVAAAPTSERPAAFAGRG
eukprot:5742309-Alexandrium_andersonii.AAC.1